MGGFMKKVLLLAVLLLASCAPALVQAPRDIVLYSANLAELRTYLISEIQSQSGGEGFGNWKWDSTTPSTTRFVANKQFGAVDWVLTVFTLGVWLVTDKPRVMECQIVGDSGKVSVLCSPANAFVFDLLDKKYTRATP
jgi:hypothetical protein